MIATPLSQNPSGIRSSTADKVFSARYEGMIIAFFIGDLPIKMDVGARRSR
jgi:hypothetical protein